MIRQDRKVEDRAELLLMDREKGVAWVVLVYVRKSFAEAKQAAIDELTEIQKAPLEIEEDFI
jgi:hypothetical protein